MRNLRLFLSVFSLLYCIQPSAAASKSPFRAHVEHQESLTRFMQSAFENRNSHSLSSSRFNVNVRDFGKSTLHFHDASVQKSDDSTVVLLKGSLKTGHNKRAQVQAVSGAIYKRAHGKLFFEATFAVQNRHETAVHYQLQAEEGDKELKVVRAPAYSLFGKVCASHYRALKSGQKTYSSRRALLQSSERKPLSLLGYQIATDADPQYVAKFPSANSRIAAILNSVDTVYQSELGIHVSVFSQRVTTDNFYPPSELNAENLHSRFMNRNLGASDANILFSGRNFTGSTIGLAWVAGACDSTYKYGIVQDISNEAANYVVAAHEMAHLIGASHDESPDCPYATSYIMTTALGAVVPTTFSACSKSAISSFLNLFGSCLTAEDVGAPSDTPTPAPGATGTPVPTPPASGTPGAPTPVPTPTLPPSSSGKGIGQVPGAAPGPETILTGGLLNGTVLQGEVNLSELPEGCSVLFRAATTRDMSVRGAGTLIASITPTSTKVPFSVTFTSKVKRSAKAKNIFFSAVTVCTGFNPRRASKILVINPTKIKLEATQPLSAWIRSLKAAFLLG